MTWDEIIVQIFFFTLLMCCMRILLKRRRRGISKYCNIGDKFYIEVEAYCPHEDDSVWVCYPAHPINYYSVICVNTKDLIPIEQASKQKGEQS